ncbi:MAG: GtrA family protein [Saprospiraceae bacterium]|nr:GtrA family protein [Saprospiraceae bacterium]MDW8484843.1 GtrA family protein [Saprospiraceae bacterium]
MRSEGFLLVKYALSSLSATVVDFSLFYLLFSATSHAGSATFGGFIVSAVVAFVVQRHWVFQLSEAISWQRLVSRYGIGVALGLGLNVGGVWLLCDVGGWSPWLSRISVALVAWYIVFLFNRNFVFTSSDTLLRRLSSRLNIRAE